MNASADSRKPPPIQITAKTTWIVLNAPYQSSGEAITNRTATSRKTTLITYVGVGDAGVGTRESGGCDWGVDSSLGVVVIDASKAHSHGDCKSEPHPYCTRLSPTSVVFARSRTTSTMSRFAFQ